MPDFSWSHLTPFFLWALLVLPLPCEPGQDFASLHFPVLLPSTTMFFPIFLRQNLKESFCSFLQLVEVCSKFLSWLNFVTFVPKSFEDPLELINPITAILGGCGNCDRVRSKVFEGLKNGATTLEGGAVGSVPGWMGNE